MNSNKIDTKESISFIWWNTSLSPAVNKTIVKETHDKKFQIILKIINILLKKLSIDFMALGEMSSLDVDLLTNSGLDKIYKVENGCDTVGKLKFDLCYIYNSNKVNLRKNNNYSSHENLVPIKAGHSYKLAQKLELEILGTNEIIHIFVSHWPSRKYLPENNSDRYFLGDQLRYYADIIRKNSSKVPYILLLGDYNDEPFDKSISEQIIATRDKSLVLKKKDIFYNPFWCKMGNYNQKDRFYGTYYYKSGKYTKWFTFDQIIFSHAFIQDNLNWKIFDKNVSIVVIENYLDMILNDSCNLSFDHLPVLGVIER